MRPRWPAEPSAGPAARCAHAMYSSRRALSRRSLRPREPAARPLVRRRWHPTSPAPGANSAGAAASGRRKTHRRDHRDPGRSRAIARSAARGQPGRGRSRPPRLRESPQVYRSGSGSARSWLPPAGFDQVQRLRNACATGQTRSAPAIRGAHRMGPSATADFGGRAGGRKVPSRGARVAAELRRRPARDLHR